MIVFPCAVGAEAPCWLCAKKLIQSGFAQIAPYLLPFSAAVTRWAWAICNQCCVVCSNFNFVICDRVHLCVSCVWLKLNDRASVPALLLRFNFAHPLLRDQICLASLFYISPMRTRRGPLTPGHLVYLDSGCPTGVKPTWGISKLIAREKIKKFKKVLWSVSVALRCGERARVCACV